MLEALQFTLCVKWTYVGEMSCREGWSEGVCGASVQYIPSVQPDNIRRITRWYPQIFRCRDPGLASRKEDRKSKVTEPSRRQG